jgi:cadmium resistance protein CadD (predicted permease)
MSFNRIYGILLTVLGIGALIFASLIFVKAIDGYESPLIYGLFGLFFLIVGIIFVRTSRQCKIYTIAGYVKISGN